MYDVEESEHTGCVRLVESRSGGAAARKWAHERFERGAERGAPALALRRGAARR